MKENYCFSLNSGLDSRSDLYSPSVSWRSFWALWPNLVFPSSQRQSNAEEISVHFIPTLVIWVSCVSIPHFAEFPQHPRHTYSPEACMCAVLEMSSKCKVGWPESSWRAEPNLSGHAKYGHISTDGRTDMTDMCRSSQKTWEPFSVSALLALHQRSCLLFE